MNKLIKRTLPYLVILFLVLNIAYAPEAQYTKADENTDWKTIDLATVSLEDLNNNIDKVIGAGRVNEIDPNKLNQDNINKHLAKLNQNQIHQLEEKNLRLIDNDKIGQIVTQLKDEQKKYLTSDQLAYQDNIQKVGDLTKADSTAVHEALLKMPPPVDMNIEKASTIRINEKGEFVGNFPLFTTSDCPIDSCGVKVVGDAIYFVDKSKGAEKPSEYDEQEIEKARRVLEEGLGGSNDALIREQLEQIDKDLAVTKATIKIQGKGRIVRNEDETLSYYLKDEDDKFQLSGGIKALSVFNNKGEIIAQGDNNRGMLTISNSEIKADDAELSLPEYYGLSGNFEAAINQIGTINKVFIHPLSDGRQSRLFNTFSNLNVKTTGYDLSFYTSQEDYDGAGGNKAYVRGYQEGYEVKTKGKLSLTLTTKNDPSWLSIQSKDDSAEGSYSRFVNSVKINMKGIIELETGALESFLRWDGKQTKGELNLINDGLTSYADVIGDQDGEIGKLSKGYAVSIHGDSGYLKELAKQYPGAMLSEDEKSLLVPSTIANNFINSKGKVSMQTETSDLTRLAGLYQNIHKGMNEGKIEAHNFYAEDILSIAGSEIKAITTTKGVIYNSFETGDFDKLIGENSIVPILSPDRVINALGLPALSPEEKQLQEKISQANSLLKEGKVQDAISQLEQFKQEHKGEKVAGLAELTLFQLKDSISSSVELKEGQKIYEYSDTGYTAIGTVVKEDGNWKIKFSGFYNTIDDLSGERLLTSEEIDRLRNGKLPFHYNDGSESTRDITINDFMEGDKIADLPLIIGMSKVSGGKEFVYKLEDGTNLKGSELMDYEKTYFSKNFKQEHPDLAQTVDLVIANSYAQKGNSRKAKEYFVSAINENPDTPEASSAKDWVSRYDSLELLGLTYTRSVNNYLQEMNRNEPKGMVSMIRKESRDEFNRQFNREYNEVLDEGGNIVWWMTKKAVDTVWDTENIFEVYHELAIGPNIKETRVDREVEKGGIVALSDVIESGRANNIKEAVELIKENSKSSSPNPNLPKVSQEVLDYYDSELVIIAAIELEGELDPVKRDEIMLKVAEEVREKHDFLTAASIAKNLEENSKSAEVRNRAAELAKDIEGIGLFDVSDEFLYSGAIEGAKSLLHPGSWIGYGLLGKGTGMLLSTTETGTQVLSTTGKIINFVPNAIKGTGENTVRGLIARGTKIVIEEVVIEEGIPAGAGVITGSPAVYGATSKLMTALTGGADSVKIGGLNLNVEADSKVYLDVDGKTFSQVYNFDADLPDMEKKLRQVASASGGEVKRVGDLLEYKSPDGKHTTYYYKKGAGLEAKGLEGDFVEAKQVIVQSESYNRAIEQKFADAESNFEALRQASNTVETNPGMAATSSITGCAIGCRYGFNFGQGEEEAVRVYVKRSNGKIDTGVVRKADFDSGNFQIGVFDEYGNIKGYRPQSEFKGLVDEDRINFVDYSAQVSQVIQPDITGYRPGSQTMGILVQDIGPMLSQGNVDLLKRNRMGIVIYDGKNYINVGNKWTMQTAIDNQPGGARRREQYIQGDPFGRKLKEPEGLGGRFPGEPGTVSRERVYERQHVPVEETAHTILNALKYENPEFRRIFYNTFENRMQKTPVPSGRSTPYREWTPDEFWAGAINHHFGKEPLDYGMGRDMPVKSASIVEYENNPEFRRYVEMVANSELANQQSRKIAGQMVTDDYKTPLLIAGGTIGGTAVVGGVGYGIYKLVASEQENEDR